MKFKRNEKILFNILTIGVILIINNLFILKPMEDKEKELINTTNKIEISKQILSEKNTIEKENIVLTLENYLKDNCTVNYIKKESEDNNNISLNIHLSGLPKPTIDIVSNMNKISPNIYLNNVEINKINEENIECEFKVTIYNT
ncbi:MAG: hypothetical protein ACRCXT_20000 [Paraclostridium sp.]